VIALSYFSVVEPGKPAAAVLVVYVQIVLATSFSTAFWSAIPRAAAAPAIRCATGPSFPLASLARKQKLEGFCHHRAECGKR
jgi:hypothetical protein